MMYDPHIRPCDVRLAKLLAYCEGKRGSRPMPARKDIDVLDLRFVRGRLLLLEVADGRRFRFRLHGTALVDHVHYDMTGRFVAELPNAENRAVLRQRCRDLPVTKRPSAGPTRRIRGDRRDGSEGLWVPPSEGGENVTLPPCNRESGRQGRDEGGRLDSGG